MKRARLILTWIIVLCWSAGRADGGVVTVDQSEDPIDIDPWTATIDDLPGPDGRISFSEAMIATNNTPGPDTVGFAIPQDEWIWQWAYPGCAVVVSGYTYYWRANDVLVIDGTTQTAFTGDTNPDGAEVVLYQVEFYFNAGNSALYGLHDVAVQFAGSNNIARGNTGGSDITMFGGSGNLIENNVCGTIKLDRSDDNIVIGNTTTRVRIWGFGSSQLALNNRIGGPALSDRNFVTGYGTVNGEGLPSGTTIEVISTTGTIIENNWIGTTVDGLSQGSLASTQGIWMQSENNNTLIKDNRIAGILGHGQGPHHFGELYGRAILVSGSGSGVTFTGNTIGLDANDAPLLGSVTGVDVGNDAASTVQDIVMEDNVIAGHLFNGMTIGHDVPQVRLTGNSIYGNEALGIDLIPSGYGFGVTPNDLLDADDGGNGLQNFPELLQATSNGSEVTVTGSLHSSPNGQFALEFFSSVEADPTGFGEGEQFLGEAVVFTDGGGDTDFDVTLTASLAPGCMITATATLEPLGATSEFSAGIECSGGTGICEDISVFQARCLSGSGQVQARILFAATGKWDGTEVTFEIDDVPYITTINANGTATKAMAKISEVGFGEGDHVVELVDPACGLGPITVNCQTAYVAAWEEWARGDAMMNDGLSSNTPELPLKTELLGNYPNPFNPSTTIRYTLSSDSRVSLKMYNALGEEVATLASSEMPAGKHVVQWDATGQPSGVYFYRLQAGEFTETRKLMLLR